MRLIATEWVLDPLKQRITASKPVIGSAIRPHILKVGNPAGSMRILVQDTLGNTLYTSASVAISALGVDHFHGVVKFDVEFGFEENQSYDIVLDTVGYTFGASDYISWCLDYDLRVYDLDYTTNSVLFSPYKMEIWERRGSYR